MTDVIFWLNSCSICLGDRPDHADDTTVDQIIAGCGFYGTGWVSRKFWGRPGRLSPIGIVDVSNIKKNKFGRVLI